MSSFNYRAEKNRFDNLWARLAVEYREAGMAPEAIEEMKKFDWDEFKQRRNWCLHETVFSEMGDIEEEPYDVDSTIPRSRFSRKLSVIDTYADTPKSDRYQWLKEITSPALLKQILSLSESDLSLINAYMFEGYSQEEIAKILGVSQQSVAKKLSRIKKFLKSHE